MRDLFLGSMDVGGWAGARKVELLGRAVEHDGQVGYWARLTPRGPAGVETVILAPRHAGERIVPLSELPLSVDIWRPSIEIAFPDAVSPDRLERWGNGELYATEAEAAATAPSDALGGW